MGLRLSKLRNNSNRKSQWEGQGQEGEERGGGEGSRNLSLHNLSRQEKMQYSAANNARPQHPGTKRKHDRDNLTQMKLY